MTEHALHEHVAHAALCKECVVSDHRNLFAKSDEWRAK